MGEGVEGQTTGEQAVPSPDEVASCIGATWTLLGEAVEDGWAVRSDGVVASVAGVPFAAVNGVWATGPYVTAATVEHWLDRVATSGLPHCLQARPADHAALAEVAARRGMGHDEDLPLMVRTSSDLPTVAGPLAPRPLDSHEAGLHVRLAAASFGAPEELFALLASPPVLALSEVRLWAGWLDDVPVTTAMSVRLGDAVGIFNVGTLESHRRRGFGGVVTAAAIASAMEAGARWSFLQSSPLGLHAYEGLGFTTIETWRTWTSGPGASDA